MNTYQNGIETDLAAVDADRKIVLVHQGLFAGTIFIKPALRRYIDLINLVFISIEVFFNSNRTFIGNDRFGRITPGNKGNIGLHVVGWKFSANKRKGIEFS